MKKIILMTSSQLALALAFLTPANAQQPAPDDHAAQATAQMQGLEEVVVTSQRRKENLQKAAIPVSVINGSTIRDANISNPAQLSTLVPALQISNGNGAYSNFYIRGVGDFTGNALTESAVSFNYDGVYIARPSSTVGFLYDLERVEVLKGPQGTLYGRNATGGAINILPQKPEFDPGGFVNAQYGNYNTVQVDGAVNVPVAEKAAIRISGIYARHDGYMKDGTDDQRDGGMRVQFRYEPTSDFSINIAADYFQQKGAGPGGTPVQLGIGNRYGGFSPQADALLQAMPHVLGGRTFDPLPNIQYQDNSYFGLNGTVNWKTDIGTFTLIPAFRQSKLNYANADVGFYIQQKEKFDQFSFEGRYASPDTNPLRTILGVYYFHERGNDPYNDINNQFGLVDQLNQHYGTNSAAAFGQLTYDVTSSLQIVGGIRYTNDHKTYSGEQLALTRVCLAGFLQCPTSVAFPYATSAPNVTLLPGNIVLPEFTADGIGQFGTDVSRDKSKNFSKVTWRAGLNWNLTKQSLLYASYSTGFKSGGFYVTRDQGVYQPETVRAYTLGSKNRFFDNRLELNLEAFYWKYANQQISHLALDSANTLVFATENVGHSTVKGVEVQSQLLIAENTLLNADVQYLKSVYNSFTYQAPVSGGAPQSGCAVTPGAISFTVDCSGQRPPQSPAWAINLGFQQTFPLQNGAHIVFNARGHYQSQTLTSLEFLADEYQSAYWLADAQLAYQSTNDRWSIAAYVNNIGNRAVKGQSFLVTYAAAPTTWGILRPPRIYGVRLGASF